MNKKGGKGQYPKGNIPTNKIILPEDVLIELSKKYGCKIIARHFNVSKQTVLRNMSEYGIKKKGIPKLLPEYWKKALRKPKSVPGWSKGLTKEMNKSIKQISNKTKGKDNHGWKPELHTGEKIKCACGCDNLIDKYDKRGRRRYYAQNHCKIGWFEKILIWGSGYGIEFTKELKEEIRKRDNYICQECNFTEEELGYSLSIHHIDYNKDNNNPNNLISLCKSCHAKTGFNRNDWANHFQSKIGPG